MNRRWMKAQEKKKVTSLPLQPTTITLPMGLKQRLFKLKNVGDSYADVIMMLIRKARDYDIITEERKNGEISNSL